MPHQDLYGQKWSPEEFQAAIDAYWSMLEKQDTRNPSVKSEVLKSLLEGPLSGRTKSAIEMRMQNISAVLEELGHPWLTGYAPLHNVGPRGTNIIKQILSERGYIGDINFTPTADPEELETKVTKLLTSGHFDQPKGNRKPKSAEVSSAAFIRDPAVKAHILLKAKGTCELCEMPAPFRNSHGHPFLEVHHVIPLTDNGPDTVDNAVALCPNCHRACHLAENAHELTEELYHRVARLKHADA